MSVVDSPWFGVHVGCAFASYFSFTLAFLVGIGYLIHEALLKKKSLKEFTLCLPALEKLDKINYRLVSLGFFLLSLAIATGSVWAKEAWGSWWSWDPKQTWSFITWLVYAVLLHLRLTSTFRGRKIAIISIMGFGLVIFTYLGVNYFFKGLHTFK